MKSVTVPKLLQRFQLPQIIVLFFLLVVMAVGAIPSYLTGHWPWEHPPKVTNLKQLNQLRQTGVTLPGWQTVEQKTITVGGHQWSIQQLQQQTQQPVNLLIFPQKGNKDQPQVEWMDIDGLMGWQTDSLSQIQFTVEPSLVKEAVGASKPTSLKAANVEARFFRAWIQSPKMAQTFAVLQWYAWVEGGNPSPSRWFWADQLAQLRRRRVSWVAVCLQIPIEPLGNLELSRPLAISLGQKIQAALMANAFSGVAESGNQ